MNTYLTALFGLGGKVALLLGAGAHLVIMKTLRVDVEAGRQAVLLRILARIAQDHRSCALLGDRVTQVSLLHNHDWSRHTTRIH